MDARSLGIEAAGATSIGRRRVNADAFLIDEAAGLLAVADGIGDEERSALVARAALDAVREKLGPPWSWMPLVDRTASDALERLLRGVLLANERVHPMRASGQPRIGATFAGAVVCHGDLALAHLGDSRAYLLRGAAGELARLTEDHTVLGDALWQGVGHEIAAALPNAHALTRAVGRRPGAEVHPSAARWAPGDVLLLCTDGVSNLVHVEAMRHVLVETTDVAEAARRLVDAACALGGRDNATAVVARRVGGRCDPGVEPQDEAS